MITEKLNPEVTAGREDAEEKFLSVRNFSSYLCEPLITEDYCIQSMPDVSPVKWHLAHTTWFFETFILKDYEKNFTPYNNAYSYLFNSYYVQAGERFLRAARGLLSRPSVNDVYSYRENVNARMAETIENCDDETFEKILKLLEIGLNHEQQHQELILTDIKHVFSINPLYPVYREAKQISSAHIMKLDWKEYNEGIYETGFSGKEFCYDNELPRHKNYLAPFAIASRLITNHEYMEFMEDDGYKRAELWLSDGIAAVANEKWNSPLYWQKIDGIWWSFTLHGLKKVNPLEPVCHVSYYEADAFARWEGCRLPSEAEWEVASYSVETSGNFAEDGNFHPVPLKENIGGVQQMFGDVWEWTESPYTAYPGFKTLPGALGEYNGKFMSGQMVLRGGSCATSRTHIRNTYRNFFPPSARWQFMGIRLARNNF